MKLILLLVALIAVLTADCRNFPDGPTNQAPPGDVYEQNEIALRGKGGKKNLQTLMGKLEYLENNLTQANLKIETELQSLRENQNNISEIDTRLKVLLLTKMENITDGDLQLKLVLQYIKDQQNNITNADIELKMELNSIMENITNGDMQLKMELQSIKDYQINITDTDTNLKIELQSLMANITDSNSLLKTDVNSMKNNLNSYNSNLVSKLDSIISKLNFTVQEKYTLFTDQGYSWEQAKQKCISAGLVMAEPQDPPALVGYLIDNSDDYFWLGARGDGVNSFTWNSGASLPGSSPHWLYNCDAYPTRCLMTYSIASPYLCNPCGNRFYAVCQNA